MLNQSISKENFRKIFEYENRKGKYLEGEYFPKVAELSEKIKRINHTLKGIKKSKEKISTEIYLRRKKILNDKKKELIDNRDKLINIELEQISKTVNNKNFSLKLSKHEFISPKPIYTLGKSPEVFFLVKHIQYTLKRLYKIKQSNREEIILQIKAVLNDKFPKYIIKIDIKAFYESINKKLLIKKLNKIPLLTLNSKRFIGQILRGYESITNQTKTNQTKGIPRGVGVSAYLSELYMVDVDERIKNIDDIIYYARYVDDIVIIFSPKLSSNTPGYINQVEKIINDNDLQLNDKTREIDFCSKKNNYQFNYLGYDIKYSSNSILIQIGKKKINRYKERIDLSFSDYKKKEKYKCQYARRLLIKRIQFLTGNTKLSNSKKSVMVGVYFSNKLNSKSSSILSLDNYLKHKISTLNNVSLQKRLSKFSFVKGFDERVFRNFTTKDLGLITSVWKNV